VPDAMFNLAVMYANGEGGPKDMALAYVWMKLAEASGLEKAGDAASEIGPKLTTEELARAAAILKPSK
jgi:TPR repeat protein